MTTIQRSNVEEPLRENTACVNDIRCITETLDDSLSFEVMDKIIACHDNIMCYSIVNHVFSFNRQSFIYSLLRILNSMLRICN